MYYNGLVNTNVLGTSGHVPKPPGMVIYTSFNGPVNTNVLGSL